MRTRHCAIECMLGGYELRRRLGSANVMYIIVTVINSTNTETMRILFPYFWTIRILISISPFYSRERYCIECICETSVEILGVNITNGLSASELVRGVVSNSAQTLYALKVLRVHGMCDTALQAIFRSVIVTKLLFASSAWSGFIKEADRQRVDAFLLRSKRCGYWPTNLPSFEELCKTSDEQLVNKVIDNKHHLLYNLLPAQTVASQNYHLRKRQHNRQLPKRLGHLTDSNFVTRMLYADSYWNCL